MDPALWELIKSPRHDKDMIEAIVRLDDVDREIRGVRLVTRFGNIATCRLTKDSIIETRESENVLSLKATRYLAPEVEPVDADIDDNATGVGKTDLRRPPGITQDGTGCVIGVIDWGVDFNHRSLKNQDGSTRLLALWDQRGRGLPDGNAYGYGVIHRRSRIDQALMAPDPYAELGYHPADADARNTGSHGTHVIDIAAGNGLGGGPEGIAPKADLVFVHLANENTEGIANLGDSVRILEAVDFIVNTVANRPCVINLSVGRHGGPHDGSTLCELAFDYLLESRPGIFIVQSCGNYFSRDIHVNGRLSRHEEITLVIRLENEDFTPNEIEIWTKAGNEFNVKVESPSRESTGWVALGEHDNIVEGDQITGRVYNRLKDPNNSDNHLDVFIYRNATPGLWKVTLHAEKISDGNFHAWIERDDGCQNCQARFVTPLAGGLCTIGTLANSRLPLVVGAYNSHKPVKEAAPFSSAGPTRDNRSKPDLVAPGVGILAARSATRGSTGSSDQLTRKAGTSMAAPHVTGTVALCFQAAGRLLSARETRDIILSHVDPVIDPRRNRHRYGWGFLNITGAVEAAAGLASQQSSQQKQFEMEDNIGMGAPIEQVPAQDHEDIAFEANLEPDMDLYSSDPDELYRHIVYQRNGTLAKDDNDPFVILAFPGGILETKPETGDVMLRAALGEPGLASVSTVVDPQLWPSEQLMWAPHAAESSNPGYYMAVAENLSGNNSAVEMMRRVCDRDGRMPSYQMILRPRSGYGAGNEAYFSDAIAEGGPVAAIGLGIAVFNTGRSLILSGDYSFSSTPSSYIHQKTAATNLYSKALDFYVEAFHPRIWESNQKFWFRLYFEFNAYDLKQVEVRNLIDKSSAMISSTFTIDFSPIPYSAPDDTVAEIRYVISGQWDPIGSGDVSFLPGSYLHIKADGAVSLVVNSEKNWVRGHGFYNKVQKLLKGVKKAGPTFAQGYQEFIYFSPSGSATVRGDAIIRIKAWYDKLPYITKKKVNEGTVPVMLSAYASTTSSVEKNQVLARKRADGVKKIIEDFAGNNVKFEIKVHGELSARTKDNMEDVQERRVEILVWGEPA